MPPWLQQLLQTLIPQQPKATYQQGNQIPQATAESRFTRTPIVVAGQQYDKDGPSPPASGDFGGDAADLQSRIAAYITPQTNYGDLQHVLQHEQIHALLDRLVGYTYPSSDIGLNNRMGDYGVEMPAYTGAYAQGELKNDRTGKLATSKDADQWQREFQHTLPLTIQQLLQRIIQSRQPSGSSVDSVALPQR